VYRCEFEDTYRNKFLFEVSLTPITYLLPPKTQTKDDPGNACI